MPKKEAGDVEDNRASPIKKESKNAPANNRILIAEDNGSIAETYKLMLEAFGYEVVLTGNGEDCIGKFDELSRESRGDQDDGTFKLIILDYHLPGKDGMDVARHMLSVAPSQRILIASSYPAEVIQKSAETLQGTVELLLKPFELDDLVDVLEGRMALQVIGKVNAATEHQNSDGNRRRISEVQITGR